jgi:hypothetical protein
MDGASNNWISRKTIDILQKINPYYIVIHWSYLHRRELDVSNVYNQKWIKFYQAIQDPSWPACNTALDVTQLPENIKHEIDQWPDPPPTLSDEDLRSYYQVDASDQDDLINTIHCIDAVNQATTDTKIIHSFIPEFCQKPQKIQQQLTQHQINFIPEFSRLDLARDGHHYDVKTSQYFVSQIVAQLDGRKLTEL